jgi:hopanoid biosynthesis associated protein HpnK
MVGERAAADAIARAHRNPALRVGLHVALCEGQPVLPAREIPDLVDAQGELHPPVSAFVRFGRPRLRPQIEREIRAQFEAFRATGLRLDHVNCHNNLQLHPVVLPILLSVAREYGVRAIRLPFEPLLPSWRAARSSFLLRLGMWLGMRPWTAHVKRRLVREGFAVNDYLFGIYDCGALELDLLIGFVQNLPDGISEVHCHLATRRCAEIDRTMPRYRHEAELRALTSPALRDALAAAGVMQLSGFGALGA